MHFLGCKPSFISTTLSPPQSVHITSQRSNIQQKLSKNRLFFKIKFRRTALLAIKIQLHFVFQIPRHQWPEAKEVSGYNGPLESYLQKYQNPVDADPMMKVQSELDETKIVLHNTIEAVLERGEKLDDLVAKSEGLSLQSKTFYKTAKKTNSCCASWS